MASSRILPTRAILGARIRERRRNLGITQAELARQLEISASYLNLIEHNKRGIAGKLLRRAAEALDLRLDELDGAAERRLLERLSEIATAPEVQALGVETDSAGELIGRFPGWARAVAALAGSERVANETARALADRLTHDPFLADTVHRMLTQIAALRSAAEILVDHEDIDALSQRLFHQAIHEESQGLSEVSEALAAYFDKSDTVDRVLTPLDEVEALFEGRENRFAEVDAAAEALAPALTEHSWAPRAHEARDIVNTQLSLLIEQIVAEQADLSTTRARIQAHEALHDYAVGALLAPMTDFAEQARLLRYDLEALADAFTINFEIACQRLTALPAGDDVPRFGYLRANAAGTLVETRGLPGLLTPRYASACPLWVLFRAQQSPEATIRQRTLFPNGSRFVFVARARNTGLTGFGKPRHYLTDMLAMSEDDAAHTVYAPDVTVPVEPVGTACRSCPRPDCVHRVADPLAG